MRTLNRPMFRMGGPIKEGVMHGIREPRNMGGRMLLVGQHPKQFRDAGGREKHALPLLAPIGMGLMHAARWAAPHALRLLGGKMRTGVGGLRAIAPTGSWWSRDPLISGARKMVVGASSPGAKGKWSTAGKWLGSPTGLAAGAMMTDILPGGRPFGPDKYLPNILGQRYDEEGKKIPGTGWFNPEVVEEKKEEIIEKPTVKKLTAAEKKLIEETKKKNAKLARDERVDNLLEIMGYDKAKKTAVGDALIDASRIITERGTLDKKNISRDLINPIIEATSKRLDKPEQIREAVGLMMAKGEIEKNIAKDKGGQLQQNARDLVAGGVFPDMRSALDHLAKKPSLREKAITFAQGLKKGSIDQDVVVATIHDEFGEIPQVLVDETEMEKLQKADNYVSDLATFETLKKAQDLGPGYYVLGSSGFIIDSTGKAKQVL